MYIRGVERGFPKREDNAWIFPGVAKFFLGRVSSDEITFYQLEAKRKTFFYENVNMRIRNSKAQGALNPQPLPTPMISTI